MRQRIFSALIALILFFLLYTQLQTTGLYIICFLVAVFSMHEYLNITLRNLSINNRLLNISFFIICTAIYLSLVYWTEKAMSLFAIGSILFMAIGLLNIKRQFKLSRVSLKQGLGVMGFIYCGVFPAYATKLVSLPRGDYWLVTLMAIVFSGDTFAYFFGRFFGRSKLLEQVSPKKTKVGALAGLVGSMLAAAICHYVFFTDLSLALLILTGLITGTFAQIGDLFESLLKRVAKVKDSGRIMPGHGGILDRVDGIYFGAPVLFFSITEFLQT